MCRLGCLALKIVLAAASVSATSGGGGGQGDSGRRAVSGSDAAGAGLLGTTAPLLPGNVAAVGEDAGPRRQADLGGLIVTGFLSTKCGDCEFRVHPDTRHCTRVLGPTGERCGGCKELWLVGSGEENTDKKPNIKSFDPWIFRGLNLRELYIQDHPELTELPPNLFFDLTGLVHLNLRRNALKTFHVLQFKGLNHLEKLSLGQNNFEDGLPGARHYELPAELWHNPGTIWRTGVFETLGGNMTDLSLDRCNMSVVPEGTFSTLINLKHLFLDENKLQTFSLDIFGANDYGEDARLGPRNLERLWLNDNELWYLPEKIFHRLRLLGDLRLTGNNLICQPDWSRLSSGIEIGGIVDKDVEELPLCADGMTPPPSTPAPPSGGSRSSASSLLLSAAAAVLSAAAAHAMSGSRACLA